MSTAPRQPFALSLFGREVFRAGRVASSPGAIKIPVGSPMGHLLGGMNVNRWGFPSERNAAANLAAFTGYVHTCANARAQRDGVAKYQIIDKRDGSVIPEDKAPIPYAFFRRPNPVMSEYFLSQLISLWLNLCGKAPVLKIRNAMGVPVMRWPLLPNRVTALYDPVDWVRYEYLDDSGKTIKIPGRDITYYRRPHPTKLFDGIGLLEGAGLFADTDVLLWKFQREMFAKGPFSSWILQYPEEATLDDDQREAVANSFEQIVGDREHPAYPVILGNGAEAKQFPVTNKGLEVPTVNEEIKERIRSAFGTSRAILGETSAETFSNAEGGERSFARFTETYLRLIDEENERSILSEWDERYTGDFENVTPADKDFALRQEVSRLGTNVLTINEVREDEGWDPVPWGDTPYDPYALPTSAATDDKGGEGTAPAPDAAAPVPAGADVQKTALNGAQVAALQAIVESVAKGALSKPAAETLILLAFPSFTGDEVGGMLAAVEVKDPSPVPLIQPYPPKPAAGKDADDDAPRGERAAKPATMSREARYRAWASLQSAAEAGTLKTLRRELARQRDEILARLEKDGPRALTMLASMGTRERAERYFAATRNPKMSVVDGVTVPARFGVTTTNRTVADSIADQGAFRVSLQKAMEKQLVQLYAGTGMAAAKQMGTAFVVDAGGIRKIANHLKRSTDSILTTNFEAIRDTLEEGFLKGEGVGDLANRIRDIYDGISRGRATVIARTETVFPANQGALDGYGAAGVERVEWIATQDEATRDSHAEMDGKTVPLGDDFKVPPYTTDSGRTVPGDTMPAPGGGQVAAQNIACRCSIGPVAPTNEEEGDDA